MNNPIIEEALRELEHKAATMRYLADGTGGSPDVSERDVFSGIADVFRDIECSIRAVRSALTVEALNIELTPAILKRSRER